MDFNNSDRLRMEFIHYNADRLMKERDISKDEALKIVTETPYKKHYPKTIKEYNNELRKAWRTK
jgi:hypothetical protein